MVHARTIGRLATLIRFHGDQKAVSVITEITVLSAFVSNFLDLSDEKYFLINFSASLKGILDGKLTTLISALLAEEQVEKIKNVGIF